VSCALALGACSQHKTAVARPAPPPAPPVAAPADDEPPIPVAAPREPVETEEIAPPPRAQPGKKS
jgi:hypothetical protein